MRAVSGFVGLVSVLGRRLELLVERGYMRGVKHKECDREYGVQILTTQVYVTMALLLETWYVMIPVLEGFEFYISFLN
jgi:hypothetical protein